VELVGGLIIVLGFIGLAKVFNLVDSNRKVIGIARSAASVVGDKSLDDLQKEKTLQQNTKELFLLFFQNIGTSLVALGIPLGVVWLMDILSLLAFDGVIKILTSAWFILTTVGISILYLLLTREKKGETSKHNQAERTLHALAFETWFPRVALSKIESRLYKKHLDEITVERPVFITALPRAGTTLTLELCVELSEFVTHRYRDMPFLLTPILWDRFSGKYRDPDALSERVHGDGMLVSVDSPESFEEIFWKEYWPSYYKDDRIIPWSDAPYPDFEFFFKEQMRKIILLRGDGKKGVRYISKNNQNIARIRYIARTFPDAKILILFRSPLQHAASLLKQHGNFLEIHKEDPFAQEYMSDTGHFDFGENLRPIDFKGWFSKEEGTDPGELSFWLKYWINAYRYLLSHPYDQVRFFSFDALCADPGRELERLGEMLDVKSVEALTKHADRIRPPKPHPVDTTDMPSALLTQSEEIYRELQTASEA
jgi:hypothetical protein